MEYKFCRFHAQIQSENALIEAIENKEKFSIVGFDQNGTITRRDDYGNWIVDFVQSKGNEK